MKKKNIVKAFHVAVLAAVLGIASLAFCQPVAADTVELPEYRLAITPTQKDFKTFEPGQTYSDTYYVRNSGTKPFNYEITFAPYNVVGEYYETNYTEKTQYNEIVDWISVDETSGTLDPGERAEVRYTITVPENIHGGAQACTIMAKMADTEHDNDTSAVQTIRQLGYLIFGNVDGDIIETASIAENKIPSFLFQAPLYAESIVENTGNVYSAAEYTFQVFPLFSDEEIYTNEEDPSREIIFPETKRYNKVTWEGSPQLGIYRVRQTVKLFDEVSTKEKLVFICPIWFLLICLAAVFIIIFSIIHRIRNRA